MSVRWKPRGHDARPGTRFTYWFANDVTRKQRIPPKRADGVVVGSWGKSVGVRFDGQERIAYLPGYFVGPEGETYKRWQARLASYPDDWFTQWLATGRKRDYDAEDAALRFQVASWPINPDLMRRTIARHGPRYDWLSRIRARMARFR